MKLGSKNYDAPEVVDDEYLETKMRQAEGLSFKLYQKTQTSAVEVNQRLCHKDYSWNHTVSACFTKLALLRKGDINIHTGHCDAFIDIFDISNVDFFQSNEPIDVNDANLVLTIQDSCFNFEAACKLLLLTFV